MFWSVSAYNLTISGGQSYENVFHRIHGRIKNSYSSNQLCWIHIITLHFSKECSFIFLFRWNKGMHFIHFFHVQASPSGCKLTSARNLALKSSCHLREIKSNLDWPLIFWSARSFEMLNKWVTLYSLCTVHIFFVFSAKKTLLCTSDSTFI